MTYPRFHIPTLGGQQFWQDVFFYGGWRIQKNALTKHCRLLNPRGIRYGWGAYKDCRDIFERLKVSLPINNPDRHLVLSVHGMGGWKENFFFLSRALRGKGYFSAGYNYLSLKGTLEEQARNLSRFLNTIEDVKDITFIAHSQGGLVVRKALEEKSPWQKRISVKGIVFIGTPNNGAALADFTKRVRALNAIAPKVRDQLTKSYAHDLKPVTVRTGLIAGVTNKGKGVNPAIPGPDDGIVGVDEVWIEGQNDRLLVESDHFTLTSRKKTISAVLRFLEGGPLGA